MIVYIIRYQVKGVKLKEQRNKQNTGSKISIISTTGTIMVHTKDTGSTLQEAISVPGTTIKTEITSTNISSTGTIVKNNTIKMLSGTSIYYGSIPIIEQLGIKYKYALVDGSGTWYIYLGTPSYDFTSIARALKGTTYTLATEKELIENKLFGNKIVFINLPEYKDKKVIMLVYVNDGIWLIQMDYGLYHKSKSYLKSLFID